jgi:hypothetical protein
MPNYVTVLGYAGAPVTSSLVFYSEFVCKAVGSAGTFTIPAAIVIVISAQRLRSGIVR